MVDAVKKPFSESRLFAWLELVRLPAVLSAPGDPLAGAMLTILASEAQGVSLEPKLPLRIGLAMLAAILFYMGGMILNDVCDVKEDRRDRPDRPIAGGRIRMRTAINVFGLLSLAALGCSFAISQATLAMGGTLLTCIFLYNIGLKKLPIFGPLSMGLCRGFSFFLGMYAVNHQLAFDFMPLLVVFNAITIYIAGITMLARYETTKIDASALRYIPAILLGIGWALLPVSYPPQALTPESAAFIVVAAFTLYQLFKVGTEIGRTRLITPPVIGRMLGLHMFNQVAVLCYAGAWIPAAIIGLAIPVGRKLRKRMYVS